MRKNKMRKNKLYMGIISFLLLFSISNIAYAQNITGATTNYCVDNSTIIHITVIKNVEKNTTRTLEIPENCPYGCDSERNVCNYAPWIKYVIIIAFLTGAFLISKFIIIPLVSK